MDTSSPAGTQWSGPVHDMSGSLLEIDEDECRALLAGVPVGRVLISLAALPCAFPVNHHMVGGEIVFRSEPGTKLTAAVNGQVVGFQADSYDSVARSGWSVLVVGHARVVSDPEGVRALEGLDLDTWFNHPPLFVAITPERITGRRVVPDRAPQQPPVPGPKRAQETVRWLFGPRAR